MGEAWTSVSPAAASPTLAVSNAADVSYVKTERMWPGETAHRRGERPIIKYTHACWDVPQSRQLTRRRHRDRVSWSRRRRRNVQYQAPLALP